jgi:predicted ArsR family transcriptional regulator
MSGSVRATWSFLTNHAQVLICIARDPSTRLREIGETVGITERAAHRLVGELATAGYISRERESRRNRYTTHSHRLPIGRRHHTLHLVPPGSSSRLATNDRYRRAHDEAKRGRAVEPRSECATSGRLG